LTAEAEVYFTLGSLAIIIIIIINLWKSIPFMTGLFVLVRGMREVGLCVLRTDNMTFNALNEEFKNMRITTHRFTCVF